LRELLTGKKRNIFIAIFLVAVIIVSFFVALAVLPTPSKPAAGLPSPLVGIETGWDSNFSDCKILIDNVKDYTNLFVVASSLILADEALLNETCDYAYKAGMYLIIYYQNMTVSGDYPGVTNHYSPSTWFTTAKERYGNHLLGIYFYDEAGGIQLDQNGPFSAKPPIDSPISYADYYVNFYWLWTHGGGVPAVANFTQSLNSAVFSSDYALYWFDYLVGYNTLFAQFGWNNSRSLQISLVRGAAQAQDKDWGAIITWTYGQPPYLESGPQLYDDMVLAYTSGANYILIYDSTQNYTGTTLTQDHYSALKNFWSYMQHNPDKHGSLKADTALVLPQDYAFGFRSPNDSVWQYHLPDNWTRKMYSDVTNLLNQYNSSLNIVYSDPQFQNAIQNRYSKIIYWPKDFESNVTYPVTDQNNGLGYNSIQEALSSYATYQNDTILVKPETYQEIFEATKPFVLTIPNNQTRTIPKSSYTIDLTIESGHLTLTT